jgi:DNA polymerase-3 subunit epsilon
LRRNDDACTWTLVDEGEGWLRPQVAWARDLDFGLATSCYGLFKSSREATGALRALAEAHQLCDVLLGLEKAKPGKPCFGHQLRRCKGACIGHEPLARHTMRLVAALTALKLAAWPFAGPALIREGEEAQRRRGGGVAGGGPAAVRPRHLPHPGQAHRQDDATASGRLSAPGAHLQPGGDPSRAP